MIEGASFLEIYTRIVKSFQDLNDFEVRAKKKKLFFDRVGIH